MEPAFTLACAVRLNESKCELPCLSLPSGTDRGTIGDGARLHFGLCRPAEQAQCDLPLLSLLQAPMRVATRLQSKSNVCTKRPSLLARASVSLAALRGCSATMLATNAHRCQPVQASRLLPCGAARRQCLLQTSIVANPCKLIVDGLPSARRSALCAIRRHRFHYDTSSAARGVQRKCSLDSHVQGRHVEGLKHDLCHALAVRFGVQRRSVSNTGCSAGAKRSLL